MMRMLLPFFLFVLTLLNGCGGHSDKESVSILFDNIMLEVVGKNRPHVKEWPEGERIVRLRAEYYGDERAVLDKFLASKPDLSAKVRTLVIEMRDAAIELEEMHEALIEEERFVLTNEEETDRDQLQQISQTNLSELGALVDP